MADLAAYGRDAPDVAWRPTPDLLAESRIARLCAQTSLDLDALQARAVADPAWFWREALDELDLRWQRQPDGILDTSRGWAWTTWWSGGAFNHAEAALAGAARLPADAPALIWEGEDGEVVTLTAHELDRAVHVTARAFAAAGIGKGTRVGIFLPMFAETAIAVLALGLLRAVFTPIFSGYAAPAVAVRLQAFEATHLVTADAFLRRGKWIELKQTADAAVAEASTVRSVIVVRRRRSPGAPPVAMAPGRDRWLDDLRSEVFAQPDLSVPPTDPETPYMVIYTSGTTGVPKGTVHVHGGFPIKAAQDLAHTFDLRAGDRLFWFTDLGWMMGPWTVSGSLLLGATPVLYEGAPDTPGPDRLWQVAARHRVTHIGVSPTLVRALLVHGADPVRGHDLSSLRVLGSTGEPWNPDPWWWYFRTVGGARLPLVNYTGGTEVSGGIVGNVVIRPIKPIAFNGPCPGIAADVVDPNDGRPVRGTVGELAIRGPWPGMTRGFWGGDTERYLETYWRRIPDLWIHGDWAQIDADGHWSLLGRSDDTLKVAGKRVGPAEVESAAVSHAAVVEAAAIGVPDELKGEVVVVLPVLRRGVGSDAGLLAEIAACVVRDLGPTLRPAAVVPVSELPRTRSGKIMRRVARAAYLGTDPGDISALENPSAVDAIRAAAGARAAT
jgi:acetyl-CoA synthetase